MERFVDCTKITSNDVLDSYRFLHGNLYKLEGITISYNVLSGGGRVVYEQGLTDDITVKLRKLGELVGVPVTEGGISFDDYSAATRIMEAKSGLLVNKRTGYYPGD